MQHILIVDDELDIKDLFLQRFRKELKEGSCQLSFAHNADDALALLTEPSITIGLVLSDINMPGKSGLELLKRIKEGIAEPPPIVVMITAYGDDDNYKAAMGLGAADFLTKPLDFGVLKECIKKFEHG